MRRLGGNSVVMTGRSADDVQSVRAGELKVGQRVRVRDRDAILSTLDADGRIDGLPFMPEMLAFAGRELAVDAVVHRTCDTVKTSGTSGTTRGMTGTVHLTGARCDGSAHGGCQARCLLYWKDAWLEPADGPTVAASAPVSVDVPAVLQRATRGPGDTPDEPVYSCQATELLKASCFASPRDLGIWVRDVRSRNATTRVAALGVLMVAFNKFQAFSRRLPRALRVRGGRSWPWFAPSGERDRDQPLALQPGDLVEVKSQAEIEATLDDKGAVRGLRFSAEMLPYCGQQARVLARVDRIIDEKSGRMLTLRDCIILEDVWCSGVNRLLCRRKIYEYWRETWLRRVDEPAGRPAA